MNSRTFRTAAFAVFLSATLPVGATFAQEQSSAPAQPTPPASSQTTAPTPNPSATPSAGGAPANGTQPAPAKRVWTNDDMGGVHRDPSISNYSGANAKAAKANGKPAAGAQKKDEKGYENQTAALQAKRPPMDEKISQLQAVLSGDTVQSTRAYGGNKIDDWHVELVDLQKRRDDIETKVSAVQD